MEPSSALQSAAKIIKRWGEVGPNALHIADAVVTLEKRHFHDSEGPYSGQKHNCGHLADYHQAGEVLCDQGVSAA